MRSLVMAACAGLLLVSGCSEGEAKPAPASDPTSTSASAPSATLGDMPAAAAEFTPEGAATFVSYYVSVLDYASKTGDTTELSRLSDPQCKGCNRYTELFTEIYDAGGKISGRDWEPSEIDLRYRSTEGAETSAAFVLKISAGTVQMSSGAEPQRHPAATDPVIIGLKYENGWRASQFAFGEMP